MSAASDLINPGTAQNPEGNADLDQVLAALERGVQVDLIATYRLVTCSTCDRWEEVLNDKAKARFDQFPVEDGGHVVGVLERDRQYGSGPLVEMVMRRLDDSMLVAASTGVLSYVRLAAESPYNLVVKENRICGIATPSDLLKLPVRVVLFTLITHLESTMGALIRRRFPSSGWEKHLSGARRQKLRDDQARLTERRMDSDTVLLCQLCDKREIIAKGILPPGQRTGFSRDLEDLEKLRNDVMHASDYVPDAHYLGSLADKAMAWIQKLEEMKRG